MGNSKELKIHLFIINSVQYDDDIEKINVNLVIQQFLEGCHI